VSSDEEESTLQVEEQRLLKCCRCRQHGYIVAKKGHKLCPFRGCQCRRCAVIDLRSEAKAYHRRLKTVPNNVQTSNGLGGAGAVDLTVNGPSGSLTTAAASAASFSSSDSDSPGSPPRGADGGGEPSADGGGEPSAGVEGRDQPSKAQGEFDLLKLVIIRHDLIKVNSLLSSTDVSI
uniref:DM domain-containing protein n=1 Tax=Salarias fasciatus TaxID=181472 RepID=A0A672GZR4_SALFA